tara:strand:- start:72 stop:377 length:306 start_codon:yes stop_codon:yes gene_type:complete
MGKVFVDNVLREATDKEQSEWDTFLATQNTSSYKLRKIKDIRMEFLLETDWWVLRGEMTSEQTAWRKSLRDIPQDYSEDKYDELLARDSNGKLTHTVWEKP